MVGFCLRPSCSAWLASCASSTQSGQAAIVGHSLKTYGWVYLAVAVILIVSAFALIAGRSHIGRWIGVVAGAILAISAIWWMPYYPIWSLTYIAVGVLVVYALVAHGAREGISV